MIHSVELQILRICAVVIITLIASFTDIRKKLIYDWITLPAIGIGILISIYECFSICNIFNFLIPLAVFLLSYPLYYAGKLGGGDVKLFTAIAALMPIRNKTIFIIDVLVFASILALAFFGIYYTAKLYWRGKLKLNYRNVIKGFGLALLLFFYILTLYLFNANFPAVSFSNEIKKEFFVKFLSIEKLEEGDVVAHEFLTKKAVKILGKDRFRGILRNEDIKKLKRAKIGRIAVYRDMPPFAPFVLLGVIAALFFQLY